MRWLIDGYNVIRRDPDLRAHEATSLEAGRRALLHLLARSHRDTRDEVIVVFDGARVSGGAPSDGRIRVIFSRPPATADDELMRLARHWREGAAVVSSDRKVQDAARRAGCPVLEVTQFLEGLDAGARSEPRDSGDDAAPSKRGNPRRLSKKARRDQRALRRLRQS
jgi:predicted RNA-binding protein with PIN domain